MIREAPRALFLKPRLSLEEAGQAFRRSVDVASYEQKGGHLLAYAEEESAELEYRIRATILERLGRKREEVYEVQDLVALALEYNWYISPFWPASLVEASAAQNLEPLVKKAITWLYDQGNRLEPPMPQGLQFKNTETVELIKKGCPELHRLIIERRLSTQLKKTWLPNVHRHNRGGRSDDLQRNLFKKLLHLVSSSQISLSDLRRL